MEPRPPTPQYVARQQDALARSAPSLTPGIFLALLFLSILTLWLPDLWPVSLFLAGTFLLTAAELLRGRPAALGVTLLALFIPAWALAQLLLHTPAYPEPTRLALLGALSYPCVVYLFSNLPAPQIDQARRAMLWFAFLLSITAILQYFTSPTRIFWLFPTTYGGVMGPILSRNHWAAFVEAILPVAIYYALRTPDRLWLYSSMAAALYASVITGASRAGAVLCTAELIAVPLLLARTRRTEGAARLFLPILGAVTLFTLIVGPEVVIDRLMQPDPYSMRRDVIEPSLAIVRDHPVMGIGAGTWPTVYPQYATIDFGVFMNEAHNDWLQWAGEGGIPYVAVFLALAVLAFRQAWRVPWAAGVPAVFLHALVDYPFSRPALAAWTLTILALSLRPPPASPSLRETLREK